jgi:hypothetical protein
MTKRGSKSLVSGKRYEGKYVALEGKKVIAFGANIGKVIERARQLSSNIPSVVFVPKSNVTYIY